MSSQFYSTVSEMPATRLSATVGLSVYGYMQTSHLSGVKNRAYSNKNTIFLSPQSD